mmetsp:Transcript_22228/g.28844  ORF Transcript_22228/g.28844 Transcript_22228/m.28844 type:complete len:279 (-) Transcript_22228:93-929(-)
MDNIHLRKKNNMVGNAQKKFRERISRELCYLLANGFNRADATQILIHRLKWNGKGNRDDFRTWRTQNITEVLNISRSLHITIEEAYRILIIQQEVKKLQAQGLSTIAAIENLTNRVSHQNFPPKFPPSKPEIWDIDFRKHPQLSCEKVGDEDCIPEIDSSGEVSSPVRKRRFSSQLRKNVNIYEKKQTAWDFSNQIAKHHNVQTSCTTQDEVKSYGAGGIAAKEINFPLNFRQSNNKSVASPMHIYARKRNNPIDVEQSICNEISPSRLKKLRITERK